MDNYLLEVLVNPMLFYVGSKDELNFREFTEVDVTKGEDIMITTECNMHTNTWEFAEGRDDHLSQVCVLE